MILLGAVGVFMMIAKPEVNPLLIVFFYSIPSNCAISLFPHEPVLVCYGKFVNLWQLSIAATIGTIVAAYLDYKFFRPVLNLSYSAKYKSHRFYKKAHKWFYKMPFIVLVVAGFSPIPFYPFKFMVYSSKYSLWRYIAAVVTGRFPRYYLLALLGFAFQIPNWIIFGLFAGMFLLVYHRRILGWITRPFVVLYRLAKGETQNVEIIPKTREKMPRNISTPLAFRIAARTIKNMISDKPIAIALEVTHNCTANCRHCDKGPNVEDNAIGPEEYGRICEEIHPTVIQIAGGEPLKRANLSEIVRAIYRPGKPPLLALVTNASLLTEKNYLELREAGIREFSISLDFPDERHDDFRRIPGLFKRLDRLIPRLRAKGHGDVIVNCCITRANYPYLLDIARKVSSWGARLNFSTYTDLRTQDKQYNLRHPEDTEKLDAIIDEMYSRDNGFHSVMNPERVMRRFNQFYKNGCYMPDCQTGRRFFIVNPDGRLTPCAMFIETRYDSQKELVEKFADNSTCGACYIALRSNTEKTSRQLLFDNLKYVWAGRKRKRAIPTP